jgi:hypothetical protein
VDLTFFLIFLTMAGRRAIGGGDGDEGGGGGGMSKASGLT